MKPIKTFDHGFRPENWFEVDVLKEGRIALEKVNSKLGIFRIKYNTKLLVSILILFLYYFLNIFFRFSI